MGSLHKNMTVEISFLKVKPSMFTFFDNNDSPSTIDQFVNPLSFRQPTITILTVKY